MSEEKPQTVEGQVEQALAVLPKDKTAIALGERGLAFENAAELYRIADAFVKGGVAPKGATAGGVMAAILKGRALGLDEITSLSNIVVIGGRVQMGGALVLALVRRHHACAEGPTYWWRGKGETRAAFVRARRVDERGAITHRFGMEEAVRAGLASKETYRQWGDDMLLWRAVARMGRRQFPDILAGCYVPGEVVEALGAAPVEPGRPAEEPPPGDPLLDELGGPVEDLPVPSVPIAPAAMVEPPAPIAPPPPEPPAPPVGETAPSREPGEDDDEAAPSIAAPPFRKDLGYGPDSEVADAPFASHADADRAIAAAEGQGRLFETLARTTHVDHGPAPRRHPRLQE